jgi:hypothetical protein
VAVPSTTTQRVVTGYTSELVATPVYVKSWQWVPVTTTSKVWIDGPPPSPGSSAGHWETVSTTTQIYKQVEVVDHCEWIPTEVAVYATNPVTTSVTQTVAGGLERTVTVPASGVIYVPGAIRSLSGDLDGSLTIVSEETVTIDGNLRYVDGNGRFACLNGTDPAAGPFVPNPAFQRNHALAVIAKGDLSYATSAPTNLEIDAMLISTRGRVGMAGIAVDADGHLEVAGGAKVLDSLRRFGTVMSSLRPLSTLLESDGAVKHGFRSGASLQDRSLRSAPPPACPNDDRITFLESMRLDPGASAPKGRVAFERGVAAMPTLKSLDQLRSAIGAGTRVAALSQQPVSRLKQELRNCAGGNDANGDPCVTVTGPAGGRILTFRKIAQFGNTGRELVPVYTSPIRIFRDDHRQLVREQAGARELLMADVDSFDCSIDALHRVDVAIATSAGGDAAAGPAARAIHEFRVAPQR